jgi:FkbM family methyltransferase
MANHDLYRKQAWKNRRDRVPYSFPNTFSDNHGISSVSPRYDLGTNTEIPVNIVALDDVILKSMSLAVVKVDVEGLELSVFKGMQHILESRRVHYIVFEEAAPFPARTDSFL